MTFKHGKFSDSPVMRQLEIVAIKRGMVTPDKIVKKASPTLEPSSDLFSDIFKLANTLRDRGFEKEANELEDNIINYKTAETHLYKAIDETGEDLLEFAHPKGSVKMHDAKDELGVVEDLLDKHDKILKVVNKTPTGKYASVINALAEDLGIKKKADLADGEEASRNVAFWTHELLKTFSGGGAFFYYDHADNAFGVGDPDKRMGFPIVINGQIDRSGGKFEEKYLQFYLNANKITKDMWAEFLGGRLDPEEVFSQDNINTANSNLNDRYKAVLKKIKLLPKLPTNTTPETLNGSIDIANKLKSGIGSLFDEFSWFDFKGMLFNNEQAEQNMRTKTVPNILKWTDQYITDLNEKFGQKTVQQPEASGLLTAWWAGNVAGKFDRLKDAALNANQDKLANEFMAIANIVRSGAGKPYSETHKALVNLSKDNAEFSDIHKLDAAAMEWENFFKSQKKASNKDKLVKEALGHPPVINAPTATPTPQAQVPHAPTHQTALAKPAMSENEKDAVISMQNSLHLLASALSDEKTAAKIKELSGLDQENANKVVSALLGTGIGGKKHTDNLDGIWGPNTANALKAAKFLQDAIAKNNAQLASKTDFTTDSQFNKGASEKDVIDKANNNTSLLNQLLTNVGAGHLVPGNVNEFDKLPRTDFTKPDIMSKVNETGDVSLGQNDLSSFDTLYGYLTKNALAPGVSFDRLTSEMKDGLPAETWENIVHFLRFRAYQKTKQNVEDKVAQAYVASVDKLYMTLKPVMDKILTNPYKNAKDAILGPGDFSAPDKVVPSQNANKGDTKQVGYNGKESGEGQNYEFVADHSENLKEQPIAYNINLRNLAVNYPDQMKYYNDFYGKLLARKLQINVQEFRQDPEVIADNIVRDPDIDDLVHIWPTLKPADIAWMKANPDSAKTMSYLKDAKLRILNKIILSMRQDLMNVIDKWEDNQNKMQMDPRAVQANNSAWNAWSKAFTQLINRITSSINHVGAGSNYYSY